MKLEEGRFIKLGFTITRGGKKMEQFRRGFWTMVSVASLAGLLVTTCNINRLPDVIFQATPQQVVEEMLEMAKVTKDDTV